MHNAVVVAVELLSLMILVGFSAFFSSSEMALFSLSRAKILSYQDNPSLSLRRIYELMHDYHRTLITIILGNMFVNSMIPMLEEELIHMANLGKVTTLILSAVVGIVVLLLFGEITPMTVAYVHSESWAKYVATPIFFCRKLLAPVTFLVGKACDKILDLLGRRSSNPLSDDEYRSWLDHAAEKGTLRSDEVSLLKEVFELRKTTVFDVMRSRVDLTPVSVSTSADKLSDLIRETRQPYVPVSEAGNLDKAYLLVSSLGFFSLPKQDQSNWLKAPCTRRAVSLPKLCTLSKALHSLRDAGDQAALIVDEYGGVSGMITIEDIYSELAGNSVELTDARVHFIELSPNSWVFDGNAELDLVREKTTWSNCNWNHQFRSNTLNGLFCEILGALPQNHDSVMVDDRVELRALAVSRTRVAKVLIRINSTVSNPIPSLPNDPSDDIGGQA